MFDTMIFNEIYDNKIDVAIFSGIKCFVTHIQHDEICATNDPIRKRELLEIFSLIDKHIMLTETMILCTSRLDQAKLGNGDLYQNLLFQLNKKKKKPNNDKDALIAETAIVNHLTLVTHDEALFTVISKNGGSSCNLYHLILLSK
jgi:hypothetical protein